MVFPALTRYSDLGLLLLRLMVSLVFFTSGLNHVRDPVARSKSINMSKSFTIFLGAVEILGSLGVAFGVLIQPAAIGLILIMFGAIQKKIFVWRIEFWANNGWNYELMLIVMCLVILFTGGGRYVLWA
ncbi:MAG TPA: DoxX family protein [Terriglobales bacterium]|jgi:putative oxidoreductase|nr:DoxX family protein [Terriglobales bacterium]